MGVTQRSTGRPGRGALARVRDLGRLETGVSLLEVTVAVAVLAIVILGAVAFAFQGRRNLDEEERKRTATELTSGLFEQLRAQPFPAVVRDTSVTISSVPYTVSFTRQAGVPQAYLTRVVATTSWPTQNARTRTFAMATYLSNHP